MERGHKSTGGAESNVLKLPNKLTWADVRNAKPPNALPGDWDGDAMPPPPAWRIKNMMVQRGIGLLSGQWGTGKTYIAIDLAVCVATGAMFAGRKVPEKCAVVYISPERPHTILRRLKIAREARGFHEPVPFFRAKTCPQLTDKGAEDAIVESVLFINQGMRRRFGVGVGLIVIDTMIVASGGETDLSNAEAQLVMRVMRGVSNRTGTFVLGVDHHGKDASRGTRGPSDKESSADMVIHVFKDQIDLVKCSEGEQGQGYRI